MRSLIIMSVTGLAAVALLAIMADVDKPRSGLHLYYVKNAKPVLTSQTVESRKVSPVVNTERLFRLSWNIEASR